MSEYTLYAAPNTYAMSVHAILEEVKANYDVKWIEIFTDKPDPTFRSISPHCRSPALMTPDGGIFETGAIAMYLGEKFPKFNLIIKPEDPRRGVFLQWFYYLGTTLQPDVMIQFHPEFYTKNKETAAELQKASLIRLSQVFKILDEALQEGPYFFGDELTILDFLLAMQTTWTEIFPNGINQYKNLNRHMQTITDRNAVRSILIKHNIN